jgi:two-component system OmpR family sensor kinase
MSFFRLIPFNPRQNMTMLWLAFTGAYLAFFYVYRDAREIAEASLDGYLEVILLGVPAVILLAGPMWLNETDANRELQSSIVDWTIGMALFFAIAVYVSLFVVEASFDRGERLLMLLMSTGFGGSAGMVIGMQSIKSQHRQHERNQSVRVARRKERERSQLEYLNHYLRHEVLNEAQKINGFASVVTQRTDVDDETHKYLDTISHSSQEIATFIKSIRAILDASEHKPDLAVVDVRSVLETEIKKLQQVHSSIDITIEGPKEAPIVAGDLLNRVFRNLFENAIKHNQKGVSIAVSVESVQDMVIVSVRDDGTGIETEDRDSIFEPPASGHHGYGLYLTQNLVQIYDGKLSLVQTGPDGTEFLLRFKDGSGENRTTPKTMNETDVTEQQAHT